MIIKKHFGIDEFLGNKIKRARIKQKRLAVIQQIFISWAAQQPSLKSGLMSE